jgi:hypothetical protein
MRAACPLALGLLAACSSTAHERHAALPRSATPFALEPAGFESRMAADGMAGAPDRVGSRQPLQPDEWEAERALARGQEQDLDTSRLRGGTLLQGFFGAFLLDQVELTDDDLSADEVESADLDTMPVIGGGAQIPLGGNEHAQIGVDVGLAIAWRADAAAFAVGGGGLTVAVDTSVSLWELYGGAYADTLRGKWRFYGGIGPSLIYANYRLNSDDETLFSSETGSGFGVGGWVRAGIERVVSESTLVGIGARWLTADIDLSNGLGDLEIEGTQVFVTVATTK